MMKLLVTTDFCKEAKKLVSANKSNEVNSLRTALILLANNRPIPKKYHDHQLKNNEYRELHISGDVLLIYKYEADKNTLIVSLKLTNITNHKNLTKDSRRSDYEYREVTPQELHDITSTIDTARLNSLDEAELNDLLESISDYASANMINGYVILSDYFIRGSEIHCYYDYVLYESGELIDSIDFVIDLNNYNLEYISELDQHLDKFSNIVKNAFE